MQPNNNRCIVCIYEGKTDERDLLTAYQQQLSAQEYEETRAQPPAALPQTPEKPQSAKSTISGKTMTVIEEEQHSKAGESTTDSSSSGEDETVDEEDEEDEDTEDSTDTEVDGNEPR